MTKGIRQDPELYNYIIAAFERSKKHLDDTGVFKNAAKYSMMYENEMWKAKKIGRAGHLSQVKIPVSFDVIETGLAVVTAKVPMPDVIPKFGENNPEYAQVAEMFKAAMQGGDEALLAEAQEKFEELKERAGGYAQKLQRELVEVFRETKMLSKARMLYREKGKTGTQFIKSVFNPETGKIENEPCLITTQFPAPNVDSIAAHKEEPYCFVPVMTVSKAKKMYGLDEIDAGAMGEFESLAAFDDSDSGFLSHTRDILKRVFTKKESGEKGAGDYVQPIECYMPADPDEREDIEVEDYKTDGLGKMLYDDENKPIKEKKQENVAKFPSGYKRVTIIYGHQDWIVEESDCPYKRPPFFESRNVPQLGRFYGISEIQAIEDLEARLNSAASNFNDNLRLTGNPKLILPHDAIAERRKNKDAKPRPVTAEPGGIVHAGDTAAPRWLQPPQLGFDGKWWMDFLKGWIDRVSHLSDAMRGFNQHSQDSGRKIRELRAAALGTFQAKMDEQVEFYIDLYKHWAFILQNLYPSQIVQRIEDEFGEHKFEVFDPAAGKDLDINVNINALSILPDDPVGAFEEALLLYDRRLPNDMPLIPPEYLVDKAPTLEDKGRIKRYIAEEQKKMDVEAAKAQAIEAFMQIAGQVLENPEAVAPKSAEEEQAFQQIFELVKQAPEILLTEEFKALPGRIKEAVTTLLTNS